MRVGPPLSELAWRSRGGEERERGLWRTKKKTWLSYTSFLLFLLFYLFIGTVFCLPRTPPPFFPLLSFKCHSSLLLAATMDDLFQREREGKRKREMKKRNGCLLTCASKWLENNASVNKAGVLFSLFPPSLLLSVYFYILFRERGNAQQWWGAGNSVDTYNYCSYRKTCLL